MRGFLLLISFLTLHLALSQTLSPEAKVSVLTIGPGVNLNDAFGHSAFHIQDASQNIDLVFNYGVYDFDTPNFYTKFAQGKLNYLIGVNYFDDFVLMYQRQNRSVKTQELNLTPDQKQTLFNYLLDNYKPENREYLYDFFYNNCATKIRDVLEEGIGVKPAYNEPEDFQPKSFRTLIQDNLEANSWGSLGIDLALGSVIDQIATPEEHMFLPEYIHTFFGLAALGDAGKLVSQEETLYTKQDNDHASSNFVMSPFVVISLLAFIILLITCFDYKKHKRSIWLDTSILIVTGLIGIILLLLWFATDHSATAQNYNILWAFPLNLILARQLLKQQPKAWVVPFLKFLIIMLALITFHWIVGIQVFALALIPLFIALAIRYVYLVRYFKSELA
jgi:hypothetical protein